MYVNTYVLAVPEAKKDDYVRIANQYAEVAKDFTGRHRFAVGVAHRHDQHRQTHRQPDSGDQDLEYDIEHDQNALIATALGNDTGNDAKGDTENDKHGQV